MDTPDFGDAFRALAELAPSDITDTLLRLARAVGASEIVAYLVDFSQSVLYPVPDRGTPSTPAFVHWFAAPSQARPSPNAGSSPRRVSMAIASGYRSWTDPSALAFWP